MDNIALWLGYAVMALCTVAGFGAALGWVLNSTWRRLVNANSLQYLREAVAYYKSIKQPPADLVDE